MSLITNENNVYFMAPFMNNDYGVDFSNFMEKDFTILVRCKLIEGSLEDNHPSYLFSRNGKHSGICLVKDNDGLVFVNFSYWINDEENTPSHKILHFVLPEDYVYTTNEYIMTCNDEEKKIKCYVNGLNVGEVDYNGYTKEDYTRAFIWFGCGTMFSEDMYKNIGNYEYDFVLGLDKSIENDEIYQIIENYKNNLGYIGDGLPYIKTTLKYSENIKFLVDFENKTPFKIWNLAFNGHNPQLYIKDNILF